MAVFRVEKNNGYTVMSNHHLRNSSLSLKAKGLLSQMLSLPEGWDYTLSGLAAINREGEDAISNAVKELEQHGYIRRQRTQDSGGKFSGIEYVIYEQPVSAEPLPENPVVDNPDVDNPVPEKPELEKPVPENPGQLNKDISSKDISKRKNKKKSAAAPELTIDELKPVIVENLRRMGTAGNWPTDAMNQIYVQLVDFYSPRPIRGNKPPPMKSARGVNGLCNKLMRESGGDPACILSALEDAISAGWVTAHPKPPGNTYASGGSVPAKRGMEYEEV